MRVIPLLIVVVAIAALLQCAVAQARVFASDKLPPTSFELKASEPPVTATPWQLSKPGDPLYDAKKEAETKNNKQSHLVHVFERGVFRGYATLASGPPTQPPATELRSAFTPKSKFPADAVELSASERPNKSDYFQSRPKTRPANVPPNYVLVRVFQGKTFIGWSYLPREAVAAPKPK